MFFRSCIIVSTLLICACSVPSIQKTSNTSTGIKIKNYNIKTPQPSDEIFNTYSTPLTTEGIEKEAKRFGLNGSVTQNDNKYQVICEDGIYSYNLKTGVKTLRFKQASLINSVERPFLKGENEVFKERPTYIIPGIEECKILSEKFITSNNLAAKGDYIYYNSVDYMVSGVEETGRVYKRTVIFKRKIGERIIHGAGPVISVDIEHKGEITGAHIDWPELKPLRKVVLDKVEVSSKSIDESVEIMNKNIADKKKISRFSPSKYRLDYVCMPTNDNERLIIPGIIASGDYIDGSGNMDKMLLFLEASSDARFQQ